MSVELRELRHRLGEGYQNISAAFKVPKNTVTSIILKWKKFGTTKTLPRDGCPGKLSNRGRRALVREGTKNPMITLTAHLGFARKHLKDSQTMRNKIICSDETNNELFGLNA